MLRDNYETVTVHLVGGPFAGQIREERYLAFLERLPASGLIMLHGPIGDALDTYYGPPAWDEESARWVRCHKRTRPVERGEGYEG